MAQPVIAILIEKPDLTHKFDNRGNVSQLQLPDQYEHLLLKVGRLSLKHDQPLIILFADSRDEQTKNFLKKLAQKIFRKHPRAEIHLDNHQWQNVFMPFTLRQLKLDADDKYSIIRYYQILHRLEHRHRSSNVHCLIYSNSDWVFEIPELETQKNRASIKSAITVGLYPTMGNSIIADRELILFNAHYWWSNYASPWPFLTLNPSIERIYKTSIG